MKLQEIEDTMDIKWHDDIDVGKLKNVPIDLKKLSDVVANEVVKNTKFDTLKTKVYTLHKSMQYR